MTVFKLTDGLRVIEAGLKAFENINSKEQQAANRQGTMGMLVCNEIMKENMRYLSAQTSVLDFLNSLSDCRSYGHTYNWTL